MGHFYGWRVSSKTPIVIRDAQPVTLNSDRRRGRGLFVRGSGFAADKPGDCHKENAHGYSAHQHADDALERPLHPPVRRKDYITVPDCCITACRKIEGRFPRREAEPAIAAGPQ